MLIGFKVSNFRSFKDLQHFSMLSGKVTIRISYY